MSKEIVNRVANSSLITIDLADYAPNVEILELDLKQFLFEGFILKEKDFRASLKEFDFKKGDFFTVSKVENIMITAQKSSKLFEISSPIKPSYKTYSN